ncbi:hypothetical protein ACQR0V_10580 [Bradyrhizobium sp. HKCCYLS2058]|uniref:hypothetical protein n=1 Tax=unclassified Bradyrhizobium TaxID=2631580 RepID=UPI003EB810D5
MASEPTATKGPLLEEIVRDYFARQGFFALRGVPLRFDGTDVTDVDIWLYARQSASIRTRVVVDVKNKRQPRALERVLWTKGLQAILGADRAIVVTTDNNPQIAKFGQQHKVVVLTKSFLDRLQKTLSLQDRITSEELLGKLREYEAQKADGDWVRYLEETKSGLISLPGFPAFNRAAASFAFFAQRIESRPHFAEQALRCALLCAAIGCIALDAALERFVFDEPETRNKAILDGITYGDSGDGRTQKSIENVLSLIQESMDGGRVLANEARSRIAVQFASVRADILADFFSREHNSSQLVPVARDLEALAHSRTAPKTGSLSAEARAVLGVFADFSKLRRASLLGSASPAPARSGAEKADSQPIAESPDQGKLI